MPSTLRVALGRTVRALRAAAGYSQEGFADAIGVHRTYMGTLERGGGNPTLETLELIAKGLRLTVSELLRATETGRLPDITPSDSKRGTNLASRSRQSRLGRVAERGDPDRR
jgi:transcriptional regulator with XRE-family HTH domain